MKISPLARGGACLWPFAKRLAFLFAVFWAGWALADDSLVFIGTYTGALSRGIYVSRLSPATGELSPPELAAATPSPCYLAVSPDGKFLYAANGIGHFDDRNSAAVSAFSIDPHSGALTFLNQASSGGPGACHVAVDALGQTLLVANYDGGSVKSFRLQAGRIAADGSFVQHRGSGPNPQRQQSPHAHCICADPSNHFVLACDLGADRVVAYELHPATGALAEHSSAAVPPGAGARHLAFSPDGRFVHVINEMGCSVTTFAWDAVAGKLVPGETISALPPDVAVLPRFAAAEILTAGNFVYATIRGHDSISVFAADPATGALRFLQNVPSGGRVPRGLGMDPTHRWLFAGNQSSDSVVEFAVDPLTGRIAPGGKQLHIGAPVDIKCVPGRP